LRDEAIIAEDNVVEEFDSEELATFMKALRDTAIFRAGAGIAAGMVMHDNEGGSAGDNGIFIAQLITWKHSLSVTSSAPFPSPLFVSPA
jgi:hypothetical protein